MLTLLQCKKDGETLGLPLEQARCNFGHPGVCLVRRLPLRVLDKAYGTLACLTRSHGCIGCPTAIPAEWPVKNVQAVLLWLCVVSGSQDNLHLECILSRPFKQSYVDVLRSTIPSNLLEDLLRVRVVEESSRDCMLSFRAYHGVAGRRAKANL